MSRAACVVCSNEFFLSFSLFSPPQALPLDSRLEEMSNVKFAEDGARDALNALRSDGDSTDFIVLGYNDKKQVVLQASGDGGVAAMNAVLDPKQIQYGMVRVQDIVDGHETVKFVWIVWQGSEVKMIAKARVTTHRGEVKDFFGQAHVTLDCNTHEECSEANVLSLVSDASGSSTRVLEGSVAGERQQQNRTVTAAGKKSGAPFEFQEEAEMDEALQMVRNGTGQEWVLVGYRDSDSNTVQLLGQGSFIFKIFAFLILFLISFIRFRERRSR